MSELKSENQFTARNKHYLKYFYLLLKSGFKKENNVVSHVYITYCRCAMSSVRLYQIDRFMH
jgi:hypothetical protein